VPAIIRNGPEWFKSMGVETAGGQKCFSVSGHVAAPANFEIDLGTPFSALLELAGGMKDGIPLKAVIPGGSSVPVVPGDIMMQTNMDYDSISKVAGSMLGSGAVIVMNETTDMVQALRRISRFYYSESCGQCTPCREGTGWLFRMLTRIVEGKGVPEDIARLEDVAGKIAGRTICALAGINVPRFCYHKKLSVAANCRMCLVEVEKAPKPLPACATPVMPDMIVHTQSTLAREAQQGTMEFLLINHPRYRARRERAHRHLHRQVGGVGGFRQRH